MLKLCGNMFDLKMPSSYVLPVSPAALQKLCFI